MLFLKKIHFYVTLKCWKYYFLVTLEKSLGYLNKLKMTNPTPLGWGICTKNRLGFSQKLY